MKTKVTIMMLLLAGMLTLTLSPALTAAQPTFVQGEIATMPLWTWSAGINVGTVTVAISGENLEVALETTGGWLIYAAHWYLDTTWPGWSFPFPLELFNASAIIPGGITAITYSVPLANLGVECGDTLYISAHALVDFELDAWGQEDPSDIGWYKYFSVIIPCEEKPAGKSPGWWKKQVNVYFGANGRRHVSEEQLEEWAEAIDEYYGVTPPDFDGYPLPPVESLDYDVSPGFFTLDDAWEIFNDTDWNHMWTHLANWFNYVSGYAPYWNN